MSGHKVRVHVDVKVPMRDGVLLSADIYRPVGDGPFPALLCRTPYDNQGPRQVEWAYQFAHNGYAVVVQDCRGRFDSDGVWVPYVTEAADGYDTQQWIGAQTWCDGNVGTFGSSYVGFTQILPAPFRSPYVKALVPSAHQEDNFGHIYCDGVLQLQNAINWAWIGNRMAQAHIGLAFSIDLRPGSLVHYPNTSHLVDPDELYRRLPLITALDDVSDLPAYRHFLRHPTFDEYWKSYSMKRKYPEVDVPALFLTGWYDNLVHEVFKVFIGWKHSARSEATRARTKLLVGPWPHGGIGSATPVGDVDFGPGAAVDVPGLHLQWYDRRLKGTENGIDDEPPIRLFVMGADVWRHENDWPLARARYTPFYLHSRGRANSVSGDGALSAAPPMEEPADTFVYDPADPVPTLGGTTQMPTGTGPKDRRPVEGRDDVLVYTTEPLVAGVEVTGPIELKLYAASSAVDTDFTATLVDVHPDGKAIILCEGIVRASFRDSLERPSPIVPGQVYLYSISLWETSNFFKAGHRIRLEISSSNFPRFNRNLNTGEDLATGVRLESARQTILHTSQHPSQILLPIIPDAG